MEIREWAHRIVTGDTLEEKLLVPPGGLKGLTDLAPGPALPWFRPSRPAHLQIAGKKSRKSFPHPASLREADMRARCLHVFGNHELMALEMMAWALLAFPGADPAFRRGLAHIVMEEQGHFLLYSNRLEAMGVRFGDIPVNDHFWRIGSEINDPLDWVCTMHLTFEQSNLDHAPYYGRHFLEAGDVESADLMRIIFEDEIRHVRFGSRWLKAYQPEGESLFETFSAHCSPLSPPLRALGPEFQEEARRAAGLDDDFIASLRALG